MAPPKNKPTNMQPTPAGSNLPVQAAPEPETAVSVSNLTVESDLQGPEPTTQERSDAGTLQTQERNETVVGEVNLDDVHFRFIRLVRDLASIAMESGRPISDIKAAAVSRIPESKEDAQQYARAFKRLQAIAEVLSSDVSAAVSTRYGT